MNRLGQAETLHYARITFAAPKPPTPAHIRRESRLAANMRVDAPERVRR